MADPATPAGGVRAVRSRWARLLAVVAAAGWITYVHVWSYGGTRPLPYRLETLRHFQPRQPETRLWISGDKEYALNVQDTPLYLACAREWEW